MNIFNEKFEVCLTISCSIVLHRYTLAMYEPPEVVQTKYQKPASQFDDAEEDGAMEETFAYSADLDLPQ